jgi:hypothetical protein
MPDGRRTGRRFQNANVCGQAHILGFGGNTGFTFNDHVGKMALAVISIGVGMIAMLQMTGALQISSELAICLNARLLWAPVSPSSLGERGWG